MTAERNPATTYGMAFLAGLLSTLAFHQSVIAALGAAGLTSVPAWSLEPTAPFRIPAVLSISLWGGAWALLLWWLIFRFAGELRFFLFAVIFGVTVPVLVQLFVVNPLKHIPVAYGWDAMSILGAMLINGAWGLGFAVFAWLVGIARR